ncbi:MULTISPECIES: ABC transporter permease [Actinomadura]|uniref:ABC transporter permease n=1 Tax=Actinomadura yumaensis TaxID=111807 RepID=A0ABW2CD61_9ACTN|nr:ABC transporter permease [Actinomadura sp. J1-007]MWK35729.1 FtsX-like permease family protein [Actinomadura sp. J1-007]
MLRTTLAGLRAHKLRLLLTAVAITLGVGFIAGTFVLTDSMDSGVQQTFARGADKVDYAVRPSATASEDIPAALVGRIRSLPGVKDVHGQVKGDAALVGRDGKTVGDMQTVGLSVPDGRLLRYDLDKGRVPRGSGEAVLDSRTAGRQHFSVGDAVSVLDSKGAAHRFTVVGLVDFGIDQDASMRGAVGFDPATAALMTGEKGVEEIDVIGSDRAAIAAAAGPKYEVYTGKRLGETLAKAAGADTKIIRTGLLIFGLVAMLVSALVIYNTFTILIAQRMREMALLRCVGATRRQVFGGVVAESAVVGLVGSVTGLLVGLGLGAGAMALFNALGANMPTAGVALTPRTVVVGLLVGIVVTVLSALLPARAATRVAPVAALRSDLEPGGGRFRLGWVRSVLTAVFAVGGLGAAFLGAVVMEKGESSMFMVAGAGGLMFLAVVTVMPALVRPLGRVAGAIPARLGGVPGRLAVENARRSPHRTATTTIALTIGVGLMSLFAVVGASAKVSSEHQLQQQFPVDFQVNNELNSESRPIPRALAEGLGKRPEFERVIEKKEKETGVAAPGASLGAEASQATVGMVSGDALGTVLKPEFTSGSAAALKPGTAVVGDLFAKDRGLATGATVQVRTPRGPVPVKIVGIYGGDLPLPDVLVPDTDFARHFGSPGPNAIYVKVKDGVSAASARTVVQDAARPYPTVKVASAAEIKEEFTDAIDMMLMIFGGLLGLAIIIALFGIANTLTLSVVERTRESALLRALGLTRRQLRRMLSVEALVMAVIGAFTGVVLGVGFGWAATGSMDDDAVFAVPYLQIVGFIALAAVAGVLAAVLPARRAAKASIVESLSV